MALGLCSTMTSQIDSVYRPHFERACLMLLTVRVRSPARSLPTQSHSEFARPQFASADYSDDDDDAQKRYFWHLAINVLVWHLHACTYM